MTPSRTRSTPTSSAAPQPASRPPLRWAVRSLSALTMVAALGFGALSPAQAAENQPSAAQQGSDPSAAEYQHARAMVPQVGPQSQERSQQWAEAAQRQAAATDTDFYATPSSLPEENGAVVRSEDTTFYQDPQKKTEVPAKATRIMYKSTDRTGAPVGVTGTALASTKPWNGKGERPLITFAPGTQGLGDSCAPSRQMSDGTEYESASITALLNSGYNVVVTDYMGSGTEGTHSYLDRVNEGHAVLDAARAARSLPSPLATADTPVGIWGYSQGGGGSASAGELAPSYAPELPVKGVYAGAVPADLQATMNNLDSGLYNAFMMMGVAGLGDDYGLDLSHYLNQKGLDSVGKVRNECTTQATLSHAFEQSKSLTTSGKKISQVMAEDPTMKNIVQENGLGQEGRHPQAPTLVASSIGDDVIPHGTNRRLAQRYCKAGTRVSFHTDATPTHVGASYAIIPRALIFMDRQFKGQPNVDDCWQVGA